MSETAHDDSASTRPADPPAILQGLRAVSAARFHSVPDVRSRIITSPHWLLEILVAGDLEISVEGGPWRRRTAGTGILYAPRTRYQEGLVDPSKPRRYTSLYVFFDDDSGQLARLLELADRFVWIEDPGRRLEHRLGEIVTGLDGGPAAAMSATGSLYQAVGLLLAAEVRRDVLLIGAGGESAQDMIATLHRYMRENLDRPIGLADLARVAALSESGLSHAYRRITGQTPMAALRGFRIEAAKLHLVRGRLTLEAVAELTGFADAFALSHAFKRLTGRSPRDFRHGAR